MASSNFTGDPAAMQAAAREIASTLTDLDGYVRPVRDGAEALPWSGAAADRYQSLLHDWLIQFTDICQALESMQTALVGSASAYGDSEDWALQAIGSAGGQSGSAPSPLQQSLGMR